MAVYASPQELRAAIRSGIYSGPTPGQCPGFVQTNMAILPAAYADDFHRFCEANPKACPVLERLDTGSGLPQRLATGADIRTDLPKYRVFRNGVLEKECTDIVDVWQDDLVCFLIGCSFSFEEALTAGGIPMKYGSDGKSSGPVYFTNIDCIPAGPFSGKVAVSMRPIKKDVVQKAVEITERFPHVHGGPVHIGNPETIGIQSLDTPAFGTRLEIEPDEVPVFWACGVTPQLAIANAKPPLAITHAAGHMFVSDLKNMNLEETLWPH